MCLFPPTLLARADEGDNEVIMAYVGIWVGFYFRSHSRLRRLRLPEASAFVYQAVGMRSVAWGRSFFVVDAKLMALSRLRKHCGQYGQQI
jgi:hypothetical protein